MAGEIVQHNQITRVQGWGQELLTKTGEADAVDRPVQYHRGTRSIKCHGVHQRIRLPMSTGSRFHQTFASFGPSPQPRQISFQTGFVDEHESLGIDLWLGITPVGALESDVFSVLLGRSRCFFLKRQLRRRSVIHIVF